MLVVTRKKNDKIVIADNIEITILAVGRSWVRLGIQAPREIAVHTRFGPTTEPRNSVETIRVKSPPAPNSALSKAV
jgi:hypothetical protein